MATAVNGRIAVSWEPVSGADEYEVYEAKEGSSLYTRVGTTADCRAVLEEKEAGADGACAGRLCNVCLGRRLERGGYRSRAGSCEDWGKPFVAQLCEREKFFVQL